MSNLIQYIVQDDPEELKKQNVNKKNYFFTSREQQEECRYNPYNLIENGRKSLTQDKAQTKEPSNIKADLLSEQVGNDAASYKIVPNTKGNITENAKAKANNIDYSLYGDGFSKEFIDEMLSNEDYQRALKEYAIPNEGGYVNNPQDPGEETNMGVAKRYHPNEDIKNLTRERANALLYKEVWNWNGINTLPAEIKGFVFDHGIRTSPQNAIETTHQTLEINPVGDIIGKNTLERLKNANYNEFLHKYKKLVHEQDKKRRGYGEFGTGWDNRTEGYHISY